ncbi:UNVERIFIED_CONTAM: DEAD/DEAH box helicase, partial [Salmonella enterica subsp. enterica serovar Weltevreden]
GSSGATNPRIREKMFEILCSDTIYDVLEPDGQAQINIVRREFSVFNIQNQDYERPLLISGHHAELFTFTGTKINRAISFLLDLNGTENIIEDNASTIEIDLRKNPVPENWRACTD